MCHELRAGSHAEICQGCVDGVIMLPRASRVVLIDWGVRRWRTSGSMCCSCIDRERGILFAVTQQEAVVAGKQRKERWSLNWRRLPSYQPCLLDLNRTLAAPTLPPRKCAHFQRYERRRKPPVHVCWKRRGTDGGEFTRDELKP